MKKKWLACVMALLVLLLSGCAATPSKSTVDDYASRVLNAVATKDQAVLQSLANKDYAGYFSAEEMASYFEQYEAWGACGADVTVGTLKRYAWQTSRDYFGDLASEACYTVSIGGILYDFEIVVVTNQNGEGMANFELERIG